MTVLMPHLLSRCCGIVAYQEVVPNHSYWNWRNAIRHLLALSGRGSVDESPWRNATPSRVAWKPLSKTALWTVDPYHSQYLHESPNTSSRAWWIAWWYLPLWNLMALRWMSSIWRTCPFPQLLIQVHQPLGDKWCSPWKQLPKVGPGLTRVWAILLTSSFQPCFASTQDKSSHIYLRLPSCLASNKRLRVEPMSFVGPGEPPIEFHDTLSSTLIVGYPISAHIVDHL